MKWFMWPMCILQVLVWAGFQQLVYEYYFHLTTGDEGILFWIPLLIDIFLLLVAFALCFGAIAVTTLEDYWDE